MNFALIRNELLYKINIDVFTTEDIEKYLRDLIDVFGLNDYLCNIIWDTNDNNLARYNFYTRDIKINRDNIIKDAINIYPFEDDELLVLFINLSIMQAVVHEVVHIYQNYLLYNANFPLLFIYVKELQAMEAMSDEEYNMFYNCFIFEREAIVTSLETILIIVKRILKNEVLFNYYLKELNTYLTIGYQVEAHVVTSPIERLYQEYFKEITPNISNIDSYDTLKLGLPINDNKLKLFNKKSRKEILQKNNLR